ncbi:MAG TPA: glycosyltransferase family 2 protein [Polyangia bacterium]
MDLSIVVEMDNARTVGLTAARRQLAALAAQVAALPLRAELLVVHDPADISRADVERTLADAAVRAIAPGLAVEVLTVPDARYYALKNAGSRAARGAIVLQTDADVVIESDFVAAVARAFERPEVEVVTGNTYIHPCETVLDRAVALFWHFPLRNGETTRRPGTIINANSVAARRELFARFPFSVDRRYRGACQDFGADLRKAGYVTWEDSAIRCGHPKPGGWWAMARRALWQGHDRCWERRWRHEPMAGPVRAARGLRLSLTDALTRVTRGAVRVGARSTEVPVIAAAAVAYELLVRAGYLVTRLAPDAIPTAFEY